MVTAVASASASPKTFSTSTTTYTAFSDINEFNRGLITPTFRPPASCLATPTRGLTDSTCYLDHYGTSYYDTACMPSSTAATKWDMYYYSPAPACPYGFFTASTIRNSFTGFVDTVVLSLGSDTSAYLCCPTGYTAQDYNHVCTSTFVGTTTITYFGPSQDVAGNWFSTAPITATMTFPDSTPMAVYGDAVPIWFQASDKALETASTSSTGTKTTGSSQTGPSTTSSASSTGTSSTSTPGLSTGAKAGIGAGVALVALAILAIIGFIIFRTRKGRHVQYEGPVPTAELHDNHLKEMPAGIQPIYGRGELQDSDPYQVRHPSELPGSPGFDRA